jgi:hypothetical protein
VHPHSPTLNSLPYLPYSLVDSRSRRWRSRMTCTTRQNQHDSSASSANTSKSAWSCESLPCSAVPALVRRGRYKGPTQHLCGGVVLSSPADAPASPPANTTLNTHAILLVASSLTSAAVRRWRLYVPVHKISYRYFQPGCGRSWPERAKRQWCHQVCRRPPRRVEKASLMSLPGAPELKKVNAGQNVFLDLYTFLSSCP